MEHKCLSPWKGAVVGGIIAFLWSAILSAVLPSHGQSLHLFTDPVSVLGGLLVRGVAAFFWTWILGKIPGLMLKDAALYGFFFGLCVGLLGLMPNGVWWRSVDAVVAWPIASMAIARFCVASTCPLPE
jgi:hypothetical protein